jgi:hypothetical protein
LEKSRQQQKEALKTEILSRKQIEHLKRAEENRLRSLDATQNVEFLRRKKQEK